MKTSAIWAELVRCHGSSWTWHPWKASRSAVTPSWRMSPASTCSYWMQVWAKKITKLPNLYLMIKLCFTEAKLRESCSLSLAWVVERNQFVNKISQNLSSKCADSYLWYSGVLVLSDSPKKKRTTDGFELHMGINFFGHYALTRRLLGLMRATAKISADGAR